MLNLQTEPVYQLFVCDLGNRMEAVEITAAERKECSKRNSALLRRQAQVPCVAYGGGQHHHFSVPMRLFRELVYTKNNYFVDLILGQKKIRCILQEVQFHPVSEMILHADFFIVDEKREIKMEVPLDLTGTPQGVSKGGRLIPHRRRLRIRALPKDMPQAIVVDVSSLDIGGKLRVRDLSPGGYRFLDPEAVLLVSVAKQRVVKKEEPVEQGGAH